MRLTFLFLSVLAYIISTGQEFCATPYETNQIQPREVGFERGMTEWKTIPMVVHVCYSDSLGGWFSEEYVQEAVDNLNLYMAEAMIQADLVHVGYQDLEYYSWYEVYESGSICFPTYGTQNSILAIDQWLPEWDPDYYCNVYVIPLMCGGILGWSYVTVSETNARDGIWLKSDIFGMDSPHERNGENKVFTHEMGHYCGLHHTFQSVQYCGDDDDMPCDMWGDFVCDTPPTKVQWSCDPPVCPEGLYNYTADNHMDYYPDSCRYHFTEGQIDRMHIMLEYQRAGLFGGEPFCLGDINNDNIVGMADLIMLLACWGDTGCLDGDLNNNGLVDIYDLNIMLSKWGWECVGFEPDPFYREDPPVLKIEKGRSPFPFK
jgi:hypothetical protein